MEQPAADFDGAWKYALEQYFERFMAFFFPAAHAAIDWSQPVIFLDTELQQIAPEQRSGKQHVDKLVQVFCLDGTPAWVLIHIEVQSQRDPAFDERMFCYHARIFDQQRIEVVSLAILGDEEANWHPTQFSYARWGCELRLRFPTVKLRELDLAMLEASANPFAVLTLLHRDAQATRTDPSERLRRKVLRYRTLLRQGYHADDVRRLLRLSEHLLRLDPDRARQARDAMRTVEREETGMDTFITSFEEIGREEGREEGRLVGREEGRLVGREEGRLVGREEGRSEGQCDLVVRLLQRKTGPLSPELQTRVMALSPTRLLDLSEALLDFTCHADLLTWLDQDAEASPQ